MKIEGTVQTLPPSLTSSRSDASYCPNPGAAAVGETARAANSRMTTDAEAAAAADAVLVILDSAVGLKAERRSAREFMRGRTDGWGSGRGESERESSHGDAVRVRSPVGNNLRVTSSAARRRFGV